LCESSGGGWHQQAEGPVGRVVTARAVVVWRNGRKGAKVAAGGGLPGGAESTEVLRKVGIRFVGMVCCGGSGLMFGPLVWLRRKPLDQGV
jgi:hypothetical protein